MATYTSINGVKLISTGNEAGTWGDSTNVNLQILDRAANGFASIALTGTSYTLPVAAQPSAAQDGHYKAIKFTGTPGGTCTVTLEQNDRARMYMLVNSTNQTVIITQGSGSNVTIAAGDSAIVLADGAGSGAAVEEFNTTATKFARRLELISETVLSSNAADVTFTLPTGYRDFQLVLNNVKSSGNTTILYIEASTDGGSTFDATANYSSLNVRHLETAGGSESTSMSRSTTGINVATNNRSDETVVIGGTTYNFPTVGASGVVNISNPLNASEFTAFSGVIVNAVAGTGTGDASGETQVQTFGGVYGLQAAVNAINLSHKTGASVAAGAVVALYGMKDY
tara:strand:- start:625 stop:1644 length:1020 start_codon:yes stop_codon:yes gene_type:complete